MAAEKEQAPIWPLPRFHFILKGWGMKGMSFQEVSGLDTESQAIEYRHGNAPQFSAIKMPGKNTMDTVLLKRGVAANDSAFLDWYQKLQLSTIDRQHVVIQLMDEGGQPTMTWALQNAWPIKVVASNLDSDDSEVIIDSMELSFDSLSIR